MQTDDTENNKKKVYVSGTRGVGADGYKEQKSGGSNNRLPTQLHGHRKQQE